MRTPRDVLNWVAGYLAALPDEITAEQLYHLRRLIGDEIEALDRPDPPLPHYTPRPVFK